MSKSFQTGGIHMEQQDGEVLLVEAYGGGGFRFLGARIEGSVIVTDTGFFPLDAETATALTPQSFQKLTGNPPEILLIGTGEKMVLLPAELRKWLQASGFSFELMDTGAAARTFNVLRLEDRRVAAVLIQVS